MTKLIPARERDAAIQALRAGVVPRLGIRHIQVGRAKEVEETVRDVARIVDGGSAVTGRDLGRSLVIKSDERAVECRVPQRRKEEAVMHVEPLGITFALRHGTMCDARSKAASEMPVRGQRPCQ